MTNARGIRRRSLVFLGSLLLAGLALQGCSGAEDPPPAKPPVSAALGAATALFIGTGATPVAGTGPRTKSLMKVEPDGTISPVTFANVDGLPVDPEVTHVEYLGEGYFALVLAYDARSGGWGANVLLRASDGVLFDISDFSISGLHVKGGYLFAMSRLGAPPDYTAHTLYRIELATMLATPVNNPAYDGIQDPGARYFVDADFDLRVEPSWNVWRIFFFDDSPPVTDTWVSAPTPFCNPWGGNGELATVYGEDGVLYAVCLDDVPDLADPTKRYLKYGVRSIDFTATGTVRSAPSEVRTSTCTWTSLDGFQCPESLIRPTTPYRLDSRSRYLPLTSGFFTMSPVTGGGVSLTWTDEALPPITLISGSYGYWREGDTIKRLHFSAGSSAEEVVTAPSIIGFKVAAGVLIYTRYITGTNIGTYAVSSPGAEPVLLLSEDMEVQQVVEL